MPTAGPLGAKGPVRERQSRSHLGEEGIQRSPPLLPRSLRFPRRVIPITSPAARSGPHAQRDGRAGRCPAARRGCGRPALSGQRPARPVPWGGPGAKLSGAPGSGGAAASPPWQPRSAQPRLADSGPPAEGGEGRPSEGGGGPGTAPRLKGLGPPGSPTHPPATPWPACRPPRPRGGVPPATEERSPRARSLLHLLSLRLAPSPRQRRAAPRPPSPEGPRSGDRGQPISSPPAHVPRGEEARAREGSGGRAGPCGRGGGGWASRGPRGRAGPLAAAA